MQEGGRQDLHDRCENSGSEIEGHCLRSSVVLQSVNARPMTGGVGGSQSEPCQCASRYTEESNEAQNH